MNVMSSRRDFNKAAMMLGLGAFAATPSSAAAQPAAPGNPATAGNDAQVPLAPPDRQPPNLKLPEIVERKAGWAIVGLGQLALEEVIPAFGQCKLSRPTALVSGHPDKAVKVAATYGIDPANIYDYNSYDRLADNPAVDIVYIILPNSMHAEYTIRALRAGKHALCEKPMSVTVAEAEQMVAAAKEAQRKLMVAYRLHYEPLNRKVMQLCADRSYGPIKTFSSSNCQTVGAPNIRLSAALGGGPVGDVGVYSINAARYCIGEEPVEVTAMAHQPRDNPRFREVAESVAFTLRFPSGALAHCDCSFNAEVSRRYRVHCEKGFIDMDPAFSYSGLSLSVKEGGQAGRKTELQIEQVNHFSAEMDHLSDCVLNGREPLTPGEEGLADMRVIAAIEEALRSGGAAKVRS